MDRFLVLGTAGYHDKTIIDPIIHGMRDKGAEIRVIRPRNIEKSMIVHLSMNTGFVREVDEFFVGLSKKDSLTVLFPEFWNPFIIPMKVRLSELGVRHKLTAFFHGGTMVPGDIMNPFSAWAGPCERSWLNCLDCLFVGSEYAKSLIPYPEKVIVAPYSVAHSLVFEDKTESNLILTSQRLDEDRGVGRFLDFAELVRHIFGGKYQFMITTPTVIDPGNEIVRRAVVLDIPVKNLSNEDYQDAVADSGFVFSAPDQELYGYSVIEQVLSGSTPILNDHPVYHELYPERFIYPGVHSAVANLDTTRITPTEVDLLRVRLSSGVGVVVDKLREEIK